MEQKTMPLSLFDLILDYVPEVFIRRLMNITPIVYEEAWERSYSDPAWDSPEARFIHPLHQESAPGEPISSDWKGGGARRQQSSSHNGRNCEYSAVKVGPFFATISAVETEKVFPRQAVSREQNSMVNFLLDQMTFPSFIPRFYR